MFSLMAMKGHLVLVRGWSIRSYIKSAGHVWQRWDLSTSSSHRGRLHKALISDGFRGWVPLAKNWFLHGMKKAPLMRLLNAPRNTEIKGGCNHPALRLHRFSMLWSHQETQMAMSSYDQILQLPPRRTFAKAVCSYMFYIALFANQFLTFITNYIPMFWLVYIPYRCLYQMFDIFATCISDIPIFGQLPSSNLIVCYCKPRLSISKSSNYINGPCIFRSHSKPLN